MTTLDNALSPAPTTEHASAPMTLRYEQAFSTADIPPITRFEPTETFLEPDGLFPLDLSGLSTLELHVLNSRVSRQREREFLSLDGPHSETEERFHLLGVELDSRQGLDALHGMHRGT